MTDPTDRGQRPEVMPLAAAILAIFDAASAKPADWQADHRADVERMIDQLLALFR